MYTTDPMKNMSKKYTHEIQHLLDKYADYNPNMLEMGDVDGFTRLSEKVQDKIKSKLAGLRKIADTKGQVAVHGYIQFLNLEQMKHSLGDYWDDWRIVVYERVDRELDKILSHDDVYLRTSEYNYIVGFKDNNHAKAVVILAHVAKQVADYFASHTPFMEIADEYLRVDYDATAEPAEAFHKNLTLISRFYSEDPKGPSAAKSSMVPEADHDAPVFQPFWDVQNEVIIGHVASRGHDNSYIARYPNHLDEISAVKAVALKKSIDLENTRQVSEINSELVRNKFVSLIVLPISYHSVVDTAHLNEIAQIIMAQDADVRKLIMIELVDYPDEYPLESLAETVAFLNGFVRHVIFNAGFKAYPYFARYRQIGIQVISIDIPHVRAARDVKLLKRMFHLICTKAAKADMKLMLHNVNLLEEGLWARRHGVQYLSGSLIGVKHSFPQHMLRHSWQEIKDGMNEFAPEI